jgi:hypothetical protein
MTDTEQQSETRSAAETTTDRDELRTIAFRMREIQRLLSMRVEQENRRLEADGVEPVRNTRFLEESITETDELPEG